MIINQDEAKQILELIAFCDGEGNASKEDLRLALRIMVAFPNQEYGYTPQQYTDKLDYVPPPEPVIRHEQLDLSIAAEVPALGWEKGTGTKINPFIWERVQQ